MFLLQLDLSHYGDSNGGKIIKIQSLDVELLSFEIYNYNFDQNYVNFDQNYRIGP
jgi:hypothetical protein